MNRKLLASAICASLFMAGPVFAQDTSASTPQSQDQASDSQSGQKTPTKEKDAKTLQAVSVTGSLLKRPEYESTSPVQVINIKGSFAGGAFDTADLLQSSAVAAGSTQINGQFGGYVVNGGTGVKPIDLRGLGANRTLVLLDGQRPGPSGTRGAVGAFDLNVIPSVILGRIEIVKDG
jgi:iron complex outermembrane receptor protein